MEAGAIGDLDELGAVGLPGPRDHGDKGQADRDQDTLEHPDQRDAHEGRDRESELDPAHPEHPDHAAHVDQSGGGHDHHGGERGVGEVCGDARSREHEDQDGEGPDDSGELGLGPGLLGHGGA